MDNWGREYILLGLRLDKEIPGFVDAYFGPTELKSQVDHEPTPSAGDLVSAALRLGDTLTAQGYPASRTAYLARQIRALETVTRKLAGETFSLEAEVEGYFDIRPQRTPEATFEAGLALYEAALPGPGSLTDRVVAWRTSYELPRSKSDLALPLMAQAVAEARQRTLTLVDLPAGENVELQAVSQQPWGAYNWYLGGYRSRIDVNLDLPTNLPRILELAAHEGYPGHHTEHALRDQLLYQARGYAEHAIQLILTPEAVISEGIATVAEEVIFSPKESNAWLTDTILPQVGITPLPGDLTKIKQAQKLLRGVQSNVAFMLHVDGCSDDEAVAYLMRYALISEVRSRKSLEFLKSPLWRAYTFTYFYGYNMMRPMLQGDDRQAVFRRLLTEQVYPSLLTER